MHHYTCVATLTLGATHTHICLHTVINKSLHLLLHTSQPCYDTHLSPTLRCTPEHRRQVRRAGVTHNRPSVRPGASKQGSATYDKQSNNSRDKKDTSLGLSYIHIIHSYVHLHTNNTWLTLNIEVRACRPHLHRDARKVMPFIDVWVGMLL